MIKPDTTHPHYEAWRAARRRALDLYHGGARVEGVSTVDSQGQPHWQGPRTYLLRHPHETPYQWRVRLTRATYTNFAAPIVDLFNAFIHERRPARSLPPALREMEADVDRRGTHADLFFAETTRLAAAGGTRFVLVDMEPLAAPTRAEDARLRRDVPYFVDIDPDQVLDFGQDARGLSWVTLHARVEQPRSAGQPPCHDDTVTLWTRDGWQRWHKGGGNTGDVWAPVARGEHGLGEIPLVAFHFEPEDGAVSMRGLPATDDVLSLIVRIFRRGSELDKMLFDRAVPLLLVNGVDERTWQEFTLASSNALIASQRDGLDARYVEPLGTSFAALEKALLEDERRVREIALRMVRPPSGAGESAEARKVDQRQWHTQLAVFARASAAAEGRCWRLAARWLGLKASGEGAIAAPYTQTYDVEEATSTVIESLLALSRQGLVSRAAVLGSDAVKRVLPRDFDAVADAALLA